MKRILFALILTVIGQFSSSAVGLNLLYPLGGEKLPANGRHTITWTNSTNLFVQLYVDWYDTNNVALLTNNSIYAEVLPAGTNSFILYEPSRWPTEYKYKIRLDSGTNGVVSTSDFVGITSNATFTATITNQAQWLPNQSRNITISWSGLQTNDTYSLILECPALEKEGYGFMITNLATGSEIGTQTITVAYPSGGTAAYPPHYYSLEDGTHQFTIYNKRCDIVTTFGSIDIVTAALRMYLGPGPKDYILRGDSGTSSTIFLDAVLATNNVHVTNLSVIFTSYSSNLISLKCVLKDGGQALATNTFGIAPVTNSQFHTQITFPVDLTITAGQIKELTLESEVLFDSGLGEFIWNNGGIFTNVTGSVGAAYVGGPAIATKMIPSYGTYMNILEVINPRFISSGSQSNSVTFGVFCKPSTLYTIETSTNLVNWSTLFTTNSPGDMMQIVIPITEGNHFFRLKE